VANFRAAYSVGTSIASFLRQNYPAELKNDFACDFQLVSSADIAGEETQALDKMVSIFLHRITRNEQLRSPQRQTQHPEAQPTLFLDLHYLLTYWGKSAEAEQTILAWVMQWLETNPVLDASVLSRVAEWETGETVQLSPTNLSLEDILRIWDALGPKYRVSVSYTARCVRVDRAVLPTGPVVARRFQITDDVHQ
jgi:hypothetical protein